MVLFISSGIPRKVLSYQKNAMHLENSTLEPVGVNTVAMVFFIMECQL